MYMKAIPFQKSEGIFRYNINIGNGEEGVWYITNAPYTIAETLFKRWYLSERYLQYYTSIYEIFINNGYAIGQQKFVDLSISQEYYLNLAS